MSDALRSATVVLPGGQTVTASASSQPDLFWALRAAVVETSARPPR